MKEFLERKLEETRRQNLYRSLRPIESEQGPVLTVAGRDIHNFSSNDYLGLASHPSLKRAAAAATRKFGTGAGASRLISGNLGPCAELEEKLAKFKHAEASLVFTSGYTAALGTIPALLGPDDFVVIDKLCHACIVDACRQSGAQMRVYPHLNIEKLESHLRWADSRRLPHSRILVVTETVFSMDGDLAPLKRIIPLKLQYRAWLMIDEAHATGIFGRHGRGLAEHFGVEHEIEITMGTLGKAIGSVGGYISGPATLIEYLVNHARSFIFSTGLPPAAYAAASAGIHLVETRPELRVKLWKNVHFAGQLLGMDPVSPILPVEIGDEARAVETSQKLWDAGYFVPAVRYPTVARGKARLRISISASHSAKQIRGLAAILQKTGAIGR